MFQGQVDVISNQATWQSLVYELVDEEDGTTTDLSDGALTVDIVVTIRDKPCNSPLVTGSIDEGQVTVPGPGFQWQFEVDDLTALCAGTYILGVKITIDDFVTDLIIGTIAVIEGN
jgi:hypothetical protein